MLIKRDRHPRGEALKIALEKKLYDEAAKIIEQDPTILAYPFTVEGNGHTWRSRYPMAQAVETDAKAITLVMEALKKHEAKIRAELVARDAEHRLFQGNLLYPLSYETSTLVPRDALPHEKISGLGSNAKEAGAILALCRGGYSLGAHLPGKVSLYDHCESLLQFMLAEQEPGALRPFFNRLAACPGAELNRSVALGDDDALRKKFSSLPQVALECFNHTKDYVRDAVYFSDRAACYNDLAQAGMDLRAVMQEPVTRGTMGEFVQTSLRTAKAQMRSDYEKKPRSAGGKQALRFLCATGALPAYLSSLAMQQERKAIDALAGRLDEYWRGEYRHCLRAAEATMARKAPVEQSALAGYAAGRG